MLQSTENSTLFDPILALVESASVESASDDAIAAEISKLEASALQNLIDKHGPHILHRAAEKGYLKTVAKLLEIAPGLADTRNEDEDNALHIAAWHGPVAVVELLLKMAPKLADTKDRCENNVLHLAVEGGDVAVVELLLRKCPKLVGPRNGNGDNVLHIAAENGGIVFVKQLLKIAPELADTRDSAGKNALHLAAVNGDIDFVKLLLEIAPELADTRSIAGGNNALYLAAWYGHVGVVAILFRKHPNYIGSLKEFAARLLVQKVFPKSKTSIFKTLISGFFESELYKEDPAKQLFTFLQLLEELKMHITEDLHELLSPYINTIAALVNNEKCERNRIIENGKTALDIARAIGIEDYLLTKKEINLLDYIASVEGKLIALPYIQEDNIEIDNGTSLKEALRNITARYSDPTYDFHPRLRKKINALLTPKEWKLGDFPFHTPKGKTLATIGLFLELALKLEMDLVRPQVKSEWAKRSLTGEKQSLITTFFHSSSQNDALTDNLKRKREEKEEEGSYKKFKPAGTETTLPGTLYPPCR